MSDLASDVRRISDSDPLYAGYEMQRLGVRVPAEALGSSLLNG